jgi:type I restriction enzyme S subunit
LKIEAATNQAIAGVIPNPALADYKFIFYFLRFYSPNLLSARVGGAQPNISQTILKEIKVHLPSLSIQQQIAAILEKADAAREKRWQANQLTEQFLQSAFLEMFGDPMTNPKGWEKAEFGDIVSDTKLGLVRGSAEQSMQNQYLYVKMNNITSNGYLDLSNVTKVNATSTEVGEYSLAKGDFLFNTRNSRELVGKTALFFGNGIYLFNNNILRIRFISRITPEFMSQLFQTSWIQRELEKRKSGTTNVFAIYYKDLRSVPIIILPLPEQQKFAVLVEKVESLRAKQRQSEQELEHLFHSLMQRAFRGELAAPAV